MILVFVQLVTGLIFGFIFGLASWFFKFIKRNRLRQWLKFAWVFFVAIIFPVIAELTDFPNAKFVAAALFGYVAFRVWGEERPIDEMDTVWIYISPTLYSTVGATVIFDRLGGSIVPLSIAIIAATSAIRFIISTIVSQSSLYTIKERIFISLAWFPKATVQAA